MGWSHRAFNLLKILLLSLFVISVGNMRGEADSQSEHEESSVLPYQDEAEKMAMYFSGELRAPHELTKRISRELKLIRDAWQDSVPVVKRQFYLPWTPDTALNIWLDDTTFESVKAGNNLAWDSLTKELKMTSVRYPHEWLTENYMVALFFSDKFHLYRLAEAFIGFPGVNHITTKGIAMEIFEWPHFVRSEDSVVVKYFFQDFCAPDIYFTYYYFLISTDSAFYLGKHAECLEDEEYFQWVMGQFGQAVAFRSLAVYQDGLETSRPAWVDTARSHLRRLEVDWQFSWTRKQ